MANEYSVNQEDLISVASAIRNKSEIYSQFVFPNGFVDAINSIKTAEMPSGFTAFASGTFTPTSDLTGEQSIEHGLGVTPNFFYLIALGNMNITNANYVISQQCFSKTWLVGSSSVSSGRRLTHWRNGSGSMSQYDEPKGTRLGDTTFIISGCSVNNAPIRGGMTYLWICGVIDGMI